MSCRIAKRTGFSAIPCASMTLGTVFHQFQSILSANSLKTLIISQATIEMNYHHPTGTWRNGFLHTGDVNLQILPCRFDKYWDKPIVRNGKDCGDISIGRHYNLIAFMKHSQLLISANNEAQSIKSACYADTMRSANILSISTFEGSNFFPLQKPTGVHYPTDCLIIFILMLTSNSLYVKKLYHCNSSVIHSKYSS